MREPVPTAAKPPPPAGADEAARPGAAARYWDRVIDSQNLERESVGTTGDSGGGLSLEDEIEFARTPDWQAAFDWLTGKRPAWVLDLGAGLGAQAFAMARTGLRVVVFDASPARMRALQARARQAGVADRIRCVVGLAENLPFRTGAVPGIFTKSVLIHTHLEVAAAEIARVLAPGGRAALVEPQPGNPFVNAYRRTLAPSAWREITRYFDPAAQQIFTRPFEAQGQPPTVVPFYFFSFFAFVFQYAIPNRALFRLTLAPLQLLDRLLFRLLPPLKKWAWFGVIRLQK